MRQVKEAGNGRSRDEKTSVEKRKKRREAVSVLCDADDNR